MRRASRQESNSQGNVSETAIVVDPQPVPRLTPAERELIRWLILEELKKWAA